MGAITRSFANNITTSGVFTSSAFNNASFDNVSSLSSATIQSGQLVLISTQNASSVSSVEFTSGIDSTYKEYMFIWNDVHPTTDAQSFQFNMSDDGGSTYAVSKTTTSWVSYNNEGDDSFSFSYYGSQDMASSTAFQTLNMNIGSDADQSGCGILRLFEPSATTLHKKFLVESHEAYESDYAIRRHFSGYGDTASAVNAIKFQIASGVFSGTIQLFGVKTS